MSNSRLLASRDRSLPAEEPVGVGVRILESLEDLEQKAPVVIVIDDAHWADIDSLRALLFVVRRLVGERVLTVLAQRSEEAPRLPEGLSRMAAGRTGTTLRLPAPAPTATSRASPPRLACSGLPTRVARQLYAHTEGNPLYITTLLSEMPEERWRTWEPVAAGSAGVRHEGRAGWTPAARRHVDWWRPPPCSAARRRSTPPRRWRGGPTRSPLSTRPSMVNLLQLRDDSGVRERHLQPSAGPGGRVRAARAAATGATALRGGRARRRRGVGAASPRLAATPPDPELCRRARRLRAAAGRGRCLGRSGVGAGRGQQAEPGPCEPRSSGCCEPWTP